MIENPFQIFNTVRILPIAAQAQHVSLLVLESNGRSGRGSREDRGGWGMAVVIRGESKGGQWEIRSKKKRE